MNAVRRVFESAASVEALKAAFVAALLVVLSLPPLGSSALLSVLNLAAVALSVFVVWKWMRLGGRGGSIVWAAVASLAGSAAVFLLFDPDVIPLGWITILHEGRSAQNLRQLYGTAAHAGPNHRFLVHLFADDGVNLRDTVRMNLWLSGLNVVWFWVLARHVFRRWWAALLAVLLLAANPVAVHMALSELPSAAIGLYCLMLAAAGGLMERTNELGAGTVRASLALLATVTVLLAQTRLEMSLLGGTALIAAWLRLRVGDAKLSMMVHAGGRALLGLTGSRWFWAAAPALVFLSAPFENKWISRTLAAFHPFNFTFLTLPFQLFDLFFPLATVSFFILGVVHSFRRWRTFLLLPISLFGIYKAHYSVACSHYEMLRYISYLLLPIAGTALFGWPESLRIAARFGVEKQWPRLTGLLLILSMTTFPLIGRFQEAFLDVGVDTMKFHFPITRDMQREVRFLMSAVERHPQCTFVAKVARSERLEHGTEALTYDYVLFGARFEFPVSVGAVNSPEEALAAAEPAPCAFLYRSLDCNLMHSNGCIAATSDRMAAEELVFARSDYNNVQERGAAVPVLRLALYELAPAAGAPVTGAASRTH